LATWRTIGIIGPSFAHHFAVELKHLCLHLRPFIRSSKICSEYQPEQNSRRCARRNRADHCAVAIGPFVWPGTSLDTPVPLVGLGLIVSIVGQFGALMLSSIKRDLGLKDTARLIPGHGGILDRFDSLILVAPAVFHYVGYFVPFAAGQPQQIFSGWQL
jgi:hypothetical protein